MEARYVEPTFAGRTKLALCVLVGFLLSISMDLWWSSFMTFVKGLPLCESLPWLRGIFLGFTLLSWLAYASAARAGILTLRSGEFPFPGAWVWSRTKVKTGWRAAIDGWVFVFLGVVCFVGPFAVGYAFEVNVIFCFPSSCLC